MKQFFLILSIGTLFPFLSSAQYTFQSKDAEKLYNNLESYYENYDYDGILNEEERILEYYDAKQDTLTALMYSFLSEAHYYYGATDLAYDYSLQELDLRQKIDADNVEGIKNIKYQLGQYADELGLFDEAEDYYLELLEQDRKAFGVRSDEYIRTALALGAHYELSLSYEDSKKGIRLLRSLRRTTDSEHPEYPLIVGSLAKLYANIGSDRVATDLFSEAINSYDQLGLYASRENALTLNQLANFYQRQGKYPEAESVSAEALDIVTRIPGDNTDVIELLKSNLGVIYRSIGNYEESRQNLEESIEMAKDFYGEGSYPEAIGLTGLGLTFALEKNLDQAEAKYLEAKAILEAIGAQQTLDYLNIFNNLSNIYKEKGNLDDALAYAVQSSEGFKEITGDRSEAYAKTLYNIGDIYMRKGENQTGEKYLRDAQRIVKGELGEFHPQYARMSLKLAVNQWAQEEMEEAEALYVDVFNNYFAQLESFFPTLSEEEKTKFYTNKLKPAFEQFNSFIIDRSTDQGPLLSMMYDYQLATKGLLLYATNKVRESILSSSDSVLINKYFDWIDQKEQLSKLYSSTNQDLETRNRLIDSLQKTSNNLEKELSESSNAFAGVYTQEQKQWTDVKRELNPGEAAIEMVRFKNYSPNNGGEYSDDIYYAALIVKSGATTSPELVLLKNGHAMEEKFLSNYRNAIKFQIDEEYSYDIFWKPIAQRLKNIQKIYFSPDGVYNQISIYTLLNSETGNFLLDEIDIELLNNTKDLTVASTENIMDTPNQQKAIFFGFPNYNYGLLENDESQKELASSVTQAASQGRGDSRGSRGSRGGSGDNENASLFNNTRGGGLSRGLRGNLQRYVSGNNLMALLPGTKKEVESIADIFESSSKNSDLYLSDNATENQLKETSNPSTLHIATHGFFLENENQPDAEVEVDTYVTNPLLRSGLILAGANSFLAAGRISEESEDGQDGILTAYEAMNMSLDKTDLVVLSACETGLGEVSNGEGVYGLQRAFQVAGAKAIIMSMWTVDDAATQELMTLFYEEWIQSGDKKAAFVKAQKRLKDKWKSPYYWGAFVMVGS